MHIRFPSIVISCWLSIVVLTKENGGCFFVNSFGTHNFVRRTRTFCSSSATTTPKFYREAAYVREHSGANVNLWIRSCQTKLNGNKWDNLVDEDDEDEFEPQGPGIAKDMRYLEFNIMRQNKHFVSIREAGGKEVTNDVYVRNPDSDTFWFGGKIARISDISVEQAIARQWDLIEEHASRLRPMELYPKRGSLEIWVAPGDSEMDVAYNRPDTKFLKMKKSGVDGADEVRNIAIGFQGEIYDSGEEGFRTWRTKDGLPMKEEIKGPDEEKRPPTDEEMVKINEMLKDQDLNALFENEQ